MNVDGNGDGWEFYGGGGHTGDGYTSAGQDGSGTINEDFLISPKYSVQPEMYFLSSVMMVVPVFILIL